MSNRKGNAILIIMGLIIIGLFFIAMLHPQSTDTVAENKPTKNIYIEFT